MRGAIISKRRIVQAVIGAALIIMFFYFKVSLIYILPIGILSGVIFGKVFCRWMCPLGFILELMLGGNSDSKQLQLYNYHKFGCPIAWISGFLNRFSLFRIKRNASTCKDCGICDDACYIATLNNNYSLYKKGKKNPARHYSCSKCLSCVDKCPVKSLKFTV